VHAEGFSITSYQLTSLAGLLRAGSNAKPTVGEGTAGVFTGGMTVD